MQLGRMFENDKYKGTAGYLQSQKGYEIARTVLYFGISLAIFLAGLFTTGDKMNLFTVVAILGCLPAGKSMVSMIMFLRFKGCGAESRLKISEKMQQLSSNSPVEIYDCVFTSYEKNYQVSHLVVKGNTICGFSEDKNFPEQEFYKHIDSILKLENYKDTSVKIFKDLQKYLERLEGLSQVETDTSNTAGIINTLKSVSL